MDIKKTEKMVKMGVEVSDDKVVDWTHSRKDDSCKTSVGRNKIGGGSFAERMKTIVVHLLASLTQTLQT